MVTPEQVTETEPEAAPPTITITFAEHMSANCQMTVTDCTPLQMWGAARMLEQYAEDQWQMVQMQQAMKAQQEAKSGIVPVRGGIKGVPQDHLRRKGN